jgi:hypothetical protein
MLVDAHGRKFVDIVAPSVPTKPGACQGDSSAASAETSGTWPEQYLTAQEPETIANGIVDFRNLLRCGGTYLY